MELEDKTREFRIMYENFLMRLAKEDPTAFSEVYQLYKGQIFSYLFKRTSNFYDAEDLTSDTFLSAFENRMKYENVGKNPMAWFLGIAKNKVKLFYREKERHSLKETRRVASPNEIVIFSSSITTPSYDEVEDIAIKREDVKNFFQAIPKLPNNQQEVVYLRAFTGLSQEEIAVTMGKRVGAVRANLSRARNSLKTILGAQ